MTMRPVLLAALPFLILPAALMAGDAQPPAPDRVVLAGKDVQVSARDLQHELQLLTEERREKAFADPEELISVAANIYVRRRMERIALEQGMLEDELVQARLRMEREQQLLRMVPRRVAQDIALPDAEDAARRYYDENLDDFTPPERIRAAHILLRAPDDSERANRMPEAEALLERIHAGEDFGELAAEYSDDGSRYMNGDLGTFERGRMVPEFDEAAFALEAPGDVSGVVSSRFGLHIIRLLERPTTEPVAFADVKERIIERLEREHRQQELNRWLQTEGAPRPHLVDEAGLAAVAEAVRWELQAGKE